MGKRAGRTLGTAMGMAGQGGLPPEVRRELLRLLFSTSKERAQLIGRLFAHPQGRALAETLSMLEADEDLRARVEIELLHSSDSE
jgi:hypothetical protein